MTFSVFVANLNCASSGPPINGNALILPSCGRISEKMRLSFGEANKLTGRQATIKPVITSSSAEEDMPVLHRCVLRPAILAFLLLAGPASAVEVTVGGLIYDLELLDPGLTYNEANDDVPFPFAGPLQATDWYSGAFSSDDTFASQIASEYLLAREVNTPVRFAYGRPFLGFVNFAIEVGSDGSIATVGAGESGGTPFAGSYVIGTATPVPEINGPVLAQAGLIFFALYLFLSSFRTRREPGQAASPVRQN